MNIKTLISAIFLFIAIGLYAGSTLRAPAYPLITIDPYTNIWSMSDTLYADVTRHWTGAEHPLKGVLTVDGVGYRFMGTDFINMEMLAPVFMHRNGTNGVRNILYQLPILIGSCLIMMIRRGVKELVLSQLKTPEGSL